MTDLPVDVVYFWCDGADPEFARRKEEAFAASGRTDALSNHPSGYAANGELALSVRSVRRFMPWARDIFVVTDRQDPRVEGVTLVDHSEILRESQIPCFNPYALEAAVGNIPGLSERFILANDDTFVRKQTAPGFFFRDGVPVTRFRICERDEVCVYQHALDRSYRAFNDRYGTNYPALWPHHNMDGCLLSTVRACAEAFRDDYARVMSERFRTRNSIHRVVWGLYDITFRRGLMEVVDPSSPVSMYLRNTDADIAGRVEEADPNLFCVNDTRFSTDADRRRAVAEVAELLKEE